MECITRKIISKQRQPLERLTLEGVMISEFRDDTILNRKGEWGQKFPPKFGILGDEDPQPGTKRKSTTRQLGETKS